MRKRLFRVVAVIVCGCSFQLFGCESQQIGDIVASSIKGTAVDVSGVVVESLVDGALGLQPEKE